MEYKTPQGREYGMVYLGKGECKGLRRAPEELAGSARRGLRSARHSQPELLSERVGWDVALAAEGCMSGFPWSSSFWRGVMAGSDPGRLWGCAEPEHGCALWSCSCWLMHHSTWMQAMALGEFPQVTPCHPFCRYKSLVSG